jgi:hypothetical protein
MDEPVHEFEEYHESVQVSFTNDRQPDGTYIYNKPPDDATCHICEHLISEHTKEQIHRCAMKQQELRSGA